MKLSFTKKLLLTIIVIAAAMYSIQTFSATPQIINYQGYLKSNGIPVNGNVNMTFSLYDAAVAGAQLCTTGIQSVAVSYGRFNHLLGSVGCNLSAINWQAQDVYLDIIVDGNPMTPREQIVAGAFALSNDAGTPQTNFVLDSDNLGAGPGASSTISFNRGSTDSDATLGWDEGVDVFRFTSDGTTLADVVMGNATASAFFGDGSNLTGISTVDNTRVAKSGDTMSGHLGISESGATSSLYVVHSGNTDSAAIFETTSPTSATSAVIINSYSNTGGSALNVFHAGTSGGAASFSTLGSGNTGNTLSATTAGLASAGRFENTNVANASSTVFITTSSTSNGHGLRVINTGNGKAAFFSVNNTGSSSPTLAVWNNTTNPSGNVFEINHTGTSGNLAILRANNAPKVIIDRTGHIFASGSLSFDGPLFVSGSEGASNEVLVSNGPGLAPSWQVSGGAGSYVNEAGDAMTGPLAVLFDTATSSLVVSNTSSGNAIFASGSVYIATGTLTIGYDTGFDGYDVNFYGTHLASSGGKAFWDASKNSFRVGRDSDGNHWNDPNVGGNSFGSGYNVIASGVYSTSIGNTNTASGDTAIALGSGTTASGNFSTSMGDSTTAVGIGATAMGSATIANGNYSTAIGLNSQADGSASTAIGNSTTASGNASVALGESSIASGATAIAMGNTNTASGDYTTAMGFGVVASGYASIAMGESAFASGTNSFAIGKDVIADNFDNAMVIGEGANPGNRLVNSTAHSLMVGFQSDIPTFFVGPSAGTGTTGNVGIATSTPTFPLTVSGDIYSTGSLRFDGSLFANGDEGAVGQALISNGPGLAPTWQPVGGGAYVDTTGDGMNGPLNIIQGGATASLHLMQTGGANIAAALVVDHYGTGYLAHFSDSLGPRFIVDNDGNIFASGTIDMDGGFSPISVTHNNAGGTAGSFTINNAVNASSALSTGSMSNSAAAFSAAAWGSAPAASFSVTGGANTAAALVVDHSGTGYLAKFSDSLGPRFIVDNDGNIYASGTIDMDGGFSPITVTTNSGGGSAGAFATNNGANPSTALTASSMSNTGAAFSASALGFGAAASLSATVVGNTSPALIIDHSGTGYLAKFSDSLGPRFIVDNDGNIFASGTIDLDGGFSPISVTNTSGGGTAGLFSNTNAVNASVALSAGSMSNTAAALSAAAWGGGSVATFNATGVGNTSPALVIDHSGTGYLAKFSDSLGPRFIVDNDGNIFASGTITLDGGYTSISATNNDPGGNAGYFTVADPTNGSTALFGGSSSNTAAAVEGQSWGSGPAGLFGVTGGVNTATALEVAHAGTGHLAEFSDSIGPRFVVLNDGDVFASGTIAAGSLASNGNYYVNYDGGDMDSYLYFYDAASPTGQYIQWNEASDRFDVSNDFYASGGISSGVNTNGQIAFKLTNGNASGIYINNPGTQGKPAWFEVNSAGNPNPVITSKTTSSAHAGYFMNTGGNSATDTVLIETDANVGGGSAIKAKTTGTGSNVAFFDVANVANNNSAIIAQTSGNGAVVMINSTGTGDLLKLQKSAVDKFVVDNNGFISTQACPPAAPNMISNNDYCIEQNERPGSMWWNAATTCQTAGRTLCSPLQMMLACNSALIANGSDNYEWTDDMDSATNAIAVGNLSCTQIASAAIGTNYAFRCCYSK